ncbi:MAG: 4'-phosphopantetheinyl transferase superfamily protein [Deltaproteobacteria bacterium]|nr:4'-phosphopantetheinyl transferase superfamily protein [Deltaproteobacteria bacterium]
MVLNMGGSEALKLPMDWVDLWWEDIDSQVKRIPEFWIALSEDERKRAARFRMDRHRERFTVCRGRLREILSGYSNGLPKAIRFRKGPGGKPVMNGDTPGIFFNLSHCGGHALYAVAYGREVGIDVEAVRPKPKAAALVDRFFSIKEREAFQTLEPHDREAAFFAGWTRKEAYVKAVGKGLRFPLDQFDVSLKPGDQNALLRVEGAPEEVKRWSLRDIDLGPGFRAALAVEMTNPSPDKDISTRFRQHHL